MDSGAAFYVKQGGVYILKLVGDIRYTMGCALGDFLDNLFTRADYDDIIVNLTESPLHRQHQSGVAGQNRQFQPAPLLP